jgi:iron complex outermembrane receptor protein
MDAGVGIGQALDPTKPMSVERINADLTYHDQQFTDNWDVQAQLSYLYTGFEFAYQIFPPGAFGGAYPIGYIGEPSAFQKDTQLALSGFYRGLDDHLIRVGAGYANYDMYEVRHIGNFGPNPFTGEQISPIELVDVSDTPAAFIPEVARNNSYAFLQDTWTISPNWELTAGVRYDDYSDFGSTTNPRLGLVWEPRSDLTAKLLYGRAFRAPAFRDLYNQNNPIAIGNPNLKPEKIETWELVFDYRSTENLHLALNLFRYEIEDKITYVPKGDSEFGYANAASWKGQGGEFELRWKTSAKSSLLFNYSYQDSKDDTTNATLSNAPQQFAFVRADYLIGSYWYLDGQLHWLDEWPRDPNDPRPAMDGYTTVDLVLRRKDIRGGKTNFAIGIRNLFDADVRYPSPGPGVGSTVVNVPNDLPGAGRFFFGEFRYKF